MTQLHAFWIRLRRCWRLLWRPEEFAHHDRWSRRIATIETLLASPAAAAAAYVVEKIASDPGLRPSKDHGLKRAEALEWVGHWAREHRVQVPTWEAMFLVEWFVGVGRGRL